MENIRTQVRVFPAAREGWWRIVTYGFDGFGILQQQKSIRSVRDIQQAFQFGAKLAKHEKLVFLMFDERQKLVCQLDYHLEK